MVERDAKIDNLDFNSSILFLSRIVYLIGVTINMLNTAYGGVIVLAM